MGNLVYYEKAADNDGYLKFSKRTPSGRHSRIVTPHFHNAVEMYICVSGKYCVFTGGEKKIIEAGEIAFVDRLTPHSAGSVECDGPSLVYFVIASSYYLNGIKWFEEETLPTFTARHEGFERIAEVAELATSLEPEMNDEMRRGIATLLFGMLKNYCGTVRRTESKSSETIVEVMRYINEHLTEDLTLEFLARHFGYEKTHFSRIFNKILGVNLREYLNRCRLVEVKRLTEECPEMSILNAMKLCGFDSPNTYYRALKRYGEQKHNF